MGIVRKCNYNKNPLCSTVGFTINTDEMIKVDAHVFRRPCVRLREDREATVDMGKIRLDGLLFEPKKIPNLPIVFFGSNYENKRKEIELLLKTLVGVSFNNDRECYDDLEYRL